MILRQRVALSSVGASRDGSDRRRRGMTLIEVMLSISIMTVAIVMFSGVVSTTARMGGEKRRASLAAQAARSQLERMRCERFADVWALYNEVSGDDPAGKGTAPGAHFAVPGLDPLESDADGFVGRILLPTSQGLLVESAELASFGLPRDLNGDTLIDDKDHSADYAILPVSVRLEWRTENGPRSLEMHTMLVDLGGE